MGKKKSTVQDALMLTDKGYRDLKKAIAACTLTNFSMFIPAMVMLQVVMELLKPFTGGSISWTNMWIYFGLGIIGAVIVFLCNKNDYKKTYVASYMESENTRIALAEHIRKLPMSVFNSKNLSELTTNLMGDVATSEHVLSHVYPQIISNVITITVVCIMFAFYDWRMALAIFISVPVAFLIIFASRRIQERLGKKHAQAKLEASEQVQEYIEGIKVVKACNLDSQQFQALEKALRTMKNLAIKFEFGSGVFVTGAQMLVQSGIGLTVFAGTSLLLNGKIELVPMLLCLLIVTRIYGPIITELTLLPELFYHQIAIRRMRTLMNIQPMEGDTEKPEENRILPSLTTAEEEMRHNLLLQYYRQYLNDIGVIYQAAMANLKHTSFHFLVADGPTTFITSDSPAFVYKRPDDTLIGLLPITPRILMVQGKNTDNDGFYYITHITDEAVQRYNKIIYDNAKEFAIIN
jgi:ATP-binding cassette, subfamily B, bacterial IrtB/YbtQ